MRMIAMVSVALVLAAAGCADSPEHKLEQARVALSSGRPDAALALAQQVLESRPGDKDATFILARAQLRLRNYAASEKALNALIALDEAAVEPQRELLNLALARMTDLMATSEFHKTGEKAEELQQAFTVAKVLGHKQADWLAFTGKLLAESEYARARLIILDSQRIEKAMLAEEADLRNAAVLTQLDPDQPVTSPSVEEKRRQIKAMQLVAEQHLTNVYETDPTMTVALLKLSQLMLHREAYDDVWDLVARSTRNPQLPAAIAVELARAVLALPEKYRSTETRIQMARMVLEAVAKEGRESPNWKTMSARLYLLDGDNKAGNDLAEQAYSVQPEDRETRFVLGWSLFKLAKYDRAKIVLERLVSDHKEYGDAWTLYGMTQVRLGNTTLADDAFLNALRINKDDTIAQSARFALIKASKGSLDQTSEDINRFYDNNKTDPDAIRFKLELEISRGGLTEVRRILGEVEKIEDYKPELRESLVGAYAFVGNLAKAQEHAAELARLRPDTADDQLRFLTIRQRGTPSPDYIIHLRELQQRFKTHLPTALALGRELMRRGEYDAVVETMEKIRPSFPEDRAIRLMLAQAFAGLSMAENAIEQIDAILKAEPADKEANEMAARIYRLMGQPEIAKGHLERIDEAQFDENENPGALAHLRFVKGDLPGAMHICNNAVLNNRADDLIHLLLAEILNQQEKAPEAEAHLHAIVRTRPNDLKSYLGLVTFYQMRDVERGLTELESLRSLNEELASFAKAVLLGRAARPTDALQVLLPLYPKVIAKRGPMALTYARAIATLSLARDPNRFAEVSAAYQMLIQANLHVNEARLGEIDLTWGRPDAATTLARLNTYVDGLSEPNEKLRYAAVVRYLRLGRGDVLAPIIDRWLAATPSNATLLSWKGDALLSSKEFERAVAAYEAALKVRPDALWTLQQLAQAHIFSRDFVRAEAAFDRMAQLDKPAQIQAHWSKGLLFRNLGLEKPAVESFEELDRISLGTDPRVNYAIGQGLTLLGRNDEATKRLTLVPPHAQQVYASAQFLLVNIEQQQAKIEQAKKRLERLMSDPRTASAAMREMVNLSARYPEDESVLAWSDAALRATDVSRDAQVWWFTARLAKLAQLRRWDEMTKTLELAVTKNPEAAQWSAGRVLLLAQTGLMDKAKKAYDESPILKKSRYGALLAAGLSYEPVAATDTNATLDLIQAVIRGDTAAAKKLVPAVAAADGILFHTDLNAAIDAVAADTSQVQVWRRIALANLALELGLAPVCEAICDETIKGHPGVVLMHGLRFAAVVSQKKRTVELVDAARKSVPDSTLSQWLAISDHQAKKEYPKAIAAARTVLSREPGNLRTSLHLVQLHRQAGQIDEAVALLAKLYESTEGSVKSLIGNDLAYSLTQTSSPDLKRAHEIAAAAVKAYPDSADFRDTLGWIEHLQGNHAAALLNLNEAIAVAQSKESRAMHLHLGETYRALGNMVWARRHLEAAASGDSESPDAKKAREVLQGLQASR